VDDASRVCWQIFELVVEEVVPDEGGRQRQSGSLMEDRVPDEGGNHGQSGSLREDRVPDEGGH
jgi:hypothetical protein